MSYWKKWVWPGILTVAVLTVFAIWMKSDFIENDLGTRAKTALTENGQLWADVEMDGRDATIIGDAPSEAVQSEAEFLTKETYAVRVVDNKSALLAAQSPYVLTAKKNGENVELSGFVPDQQTREAVLTAAKEALPTAKVTDNLSLARGASQNFVSHVGYGFERLGSLSEGEVSLSDTNLNVVGRTDSFENYNSITSALTNNLPQGMVLAKNEVTAPLVTPYTWGAEYDGQQVVLNGHVPSEDARTNLISKLETALPDVKITDNQRVASGNPEEFSAASSFSVSQLPLFSQGSVEIKDKELSVRGTANSVANYEAGLALKDADLPADYDLGNLEISPSTVSPYVWGAAFDGSKAEVTGFIPDETTRKSVLSAVSKSLPGVEVSDKMRVAAGAPAGFVNSARFGANQLTRFTEGSVSLSDRALTVHGTAKNPASYNAATAALTSTLPGKMTLANENILPPQISPYVWAATNNGSTLELSGFVPDDQTRGDIVAMAKSKLPDTKVEDAMVLGQGAPEGFAQGTGFALDQLARFSSGKVGLSDLEFSMDGVAKTTADFNGGKNLSAESLPSGMTIASENISPATVSPYNWGASYDGTTTTLTGFVPNGETRTALIEQAEKSIPSAKIDDQMQIAAGASESFVPAASGSLNWLKRFSKGKVALTDDNLAVSGVAKTSAQYLVAENAIVGALPGNVKLTSSDIQPPTNTGDYEWKAEKKGDNIILSGSVPSRLDRQAVASMAKTQNPNSSVINRLIVKTGSPDNFSDNTNEALSLLGEMEYGSAQIKNSDLSVAGRAKSVDAYYGLVEKLGAEGRNIEPAVVSPYVWSVDDSGENTVITGFVPNQGVGNTNLAAARAIFEKPVVDQQQIASGAPQDFANASIALMEGAEKLQDGAGSLTDNTALLSGRMEFEEEANAIGDIVEAKLASNYTLNRNFTFPPLPEKPVIVLKQEFKPEPTPDSVPQVVLKPEFKPEPTPDPAPVVVLKPEFKPEPTSDPTPEVVLKPEFKPTPTPDPVCNTDFAALFAGEKVQFDSARAIIKSASYPLLNRIAAELKNCREYKIEVGGHTDAQGSASYNQGLSEARANAVLKYITARDATLGDNLSAKGYGEEQPIAPNTDAERAKNRRIEFKIIE